MLDEIHNGDWFRGIRSVGYRIFNTFRKEGHTYLHA